MVGILLFCPPPDIVKQIGFFLTLIRQPVWEKENWIQNRYILLKYWPFVTSSVWSWRGWINTNVVANIDTLDITHVKKDQNLFVLDRNIQYHITVCKQRIIIK